MNNAPEGSSSLLNTDDRTTAILAYLTLIGFIIAVVLHGSKKTQLGAYHLRQALGLFVTALAFWPLSIFLAFIPILGWLVIMAGWVGILIFVLMGLIAAASGHQKPVPILGAMYQQWFAKAFA